MVERYTPDICIYHGDCLDGFGAAWAIWKRWRSCEFRPGYYGRDLPLDGTEGKNVLFVDFSASHAALTALAGIAASVVVLDHHKTAKAELEAFVTNDIIDDFQEILEKRKRAGGLPIVAFFEEQRSGAAMAWEFACRGEDYPLPMVLSYIQDRDLWTFYYGDDTRAVAAALQSYPMDFEIWDAMMFDGPRLMTEGQALLRLNRMNVEKMLKETRQHVIGDYTVPVANIPYFYASDAGNALLQLHPGAPFAATYFDRADGFRQWSLRSEDTRLDVSAIAKAFGGGGHRNAAGFQEPAPAGTADVNDDLPPEDTAIARCEACGIHVQEGEPYLPGPDTDLCGTCAPTFQDLIDEPEGFVNADGDPLTPEQCREWFDRHIAGGGQPTDSMATITGQQDVAAPSEAPVAAVIGFYPGTREPRLLSWNEMPHGEHKLYAAPPPPESHLVGEPTGYLVKRYSNDGVLLDTELSFTKPTIRSTAKTEFVPLYAARAASGPHSKCAICEAPHDNDVLTDICTSCEARINEEGSP